MTEKTFFEKVGGEPFFRQIVDEFYAAVPNDPILSSMYPMDDLAGANERLRLFLIQYWGGPSTYSEQRGHPRLRMRHLPFKIDIAAKNAWLTAMTTAIKAQNLNPDLELEILDYMQSTARFMINTEENETIKWGNPNAS